MFAFHFNRDQKVELSKALFNFGNIIGVTVIVNQAVFGVLTPGTYIFGLFLFAILFTAATLLLASERKKP